jgi:hypothetical protein
MTLYFPSVPASAKAALRLVKSLGPLLLAQSSRLSEAYAEHNLRLAKVDVIKELMIEEGRMILGVVKKLREKSVDATPEERIRLRHDIETAERDFRQLSVYQRAIDHVPEITVAQNSITESLEDYGEISIPWLDRFNDLARRQNEPWRAELLARALALESSTGGAVNQRGLWFIGTMDETVFHAFAAILDAAPKFNDHHLIPNLPKYSERALPSCTLGPSFKIGQLTFILYEVGLIGSVLESSVTFEKGHGVTVTYGMRRVTGTATTDIDLSGVILTSLAHTLAKLYEPKVIDLGLEIFYDWIDTVRSSALEVTEEI